MAVTLEQFKLFVYPEFGEIKFYVTGSAGSEYTLRAMNVNPHVHGALNISTTLKNITTASLNINGVDREIHVTSSAVIKGVSGSYYHFGVQDLNIEIAPAGNSTLASNGRVSVSLDPAPPDFRFRNNDYQALFNVVSGNRTTPFIFDIDKSAGATVPVNQTQIKNDEAVPAQYQELNYTSLARIRSRYGGAKTTEAEFGISPSISATPFEGAIYPLNLSNGIICSQSFQDRKLENLLFSFDPAYFNNPVANAGINELDIDNLTNPKPRLNQISTQIHRVFFGATPATARTVQITVTGSLNISSGDLLLYSGSNATSGSEYIRATNTTYSVSTNLTTIQGSLKALEKYGETTTYTRANKTKPGLTGDILYRISSDTVYSVDQNQIFKVTNKKLYNATNTDILIVDNTGKVVLTSTTCTV